MARVVKMNKIAPLATHVKTSQAITGLLAQQPCNNTVNSIGTIRVLIMFQLHILYSLANPQGLFAYSRKCKTRLTKFMVVVTSLFNHVISSFPDKKF